MGTSTLSTYYGRQQSECDQSSQKKTSRRKSGQSTRPRSSTARYIRAVEDRPSFRSSAHQVEAGCGRCEVEGLLQLTLSLRISYSRRACLGSEFPTLSSSHGEWPAGGANALRFSGALRVLACDIRLCILNNDGQSAAQFAHLLRLDSELGNVGGL